jgi:hypothetical protein
MLCEDIVIESSHEDGGAAQCHSKCANTFHLSCLQKTLPLYTIDGCRVRCPACYFIVPGFKLLSYPTLVLSEHQSFDVLKA